MDEFFAEVIGFVIMMLLLMLVISILLKGEFL